MIGDRLMRHTAMPGRASSLHAVAAQCSRFRYVALHIELRIVFDRLAGLGIETPGPVEIIHVLPALDEAAIGAIERVEEAIAPEMSYDLAALAVDRGVVEQMNAVLVGVPRVVRRVLVMPDELAGLDIDRHRRIRIEIV